MGRGMYFKPANSMKFPFLIVGDYELVALIKLKPIIYS
tara:strand:- start:163 stop:276 length:114 start_codon:yes stop_codon:yes gene_type:complete